tara:strand:+ start:1127 stop:1258 length:132 start_codon:yes stop_codon:yes gene_type:complete
MDIGNVEKLKVVVDEEVDGDFGKEKVLFMYKVERRMMETEERS